MALPRDGRAKGFIVLARKLFDGDPLFDTPRTFSQFEAWVDLLQLAAFTEHARFISGDVVTLKRGEVLVSLRFLASRWKWSPNKAGRFFDLLAKLGRISEQARNRHGTVYLIDGYDRYQSFETDYEQKTEQTRNSDGTGTEQRRNRHGTNITHGNQENSGNTGDSGNHLEPEKRPCTEPAQPDLFASRPGKPGAPQEEPVMSLVCLPGKAHGPSQWPVFPSQVSGWAESFPGIDVMQELRQARDWLTANPRKRKTYDGVHPFLFSWMKRAQNRSGHDYGGNGRTEPTRALDPSTMELVREIELASRH